MNKLFFAIATLTLATAANALPPARPDLAVTAGRSANDRDASGKQSSEPRRIIGGHSSSDENGAPVRLG